MRSRYQRVLIVEDDLATLFAMQRLFAHAGWKVAQSRTVTGAMGQLDPPPDWIILDLGLADGDGEEVLSHVRRHAIPSRVAVVSGRLDQDRHTVVGVLTPDLVLRKPLRFGDLLRACGGEE
jgi:DNA-binding response OmpR family regulator